MCYVCSPLQYGFYLSERLHVCLSYCDRMYQACATALMKGTPVGQLYTSGREFCLSRRFEIQDLHNSSSCFSDDDLVTKFRRTRAGDSILSSTDGHRPHSYPFLLVLYLATVFGVFLHE